MPEGAHREKRRKVHPPTTLERAFELARSGACRTLGEITLRLKSEGLSSVEAHMAGASIRSELRQICQGGRVLSRVPDQPAAETDEEPDD